MVILQILELINQLRPLTLYLGDVILRKKLTIPTKYCFQISANLQTLKIIKTGTVATVYCLYHTGLMIH